MYQMPTIPLDKVELTDDERKLVEHCIASKGKNKGRLKASKPKINYTVYEHNGRQYRQSDWTGKAAYVWRMIAFQLCGWQPHCCLPVMAEFDLPVSSHDDDWMAKQSAMKKELDAVADKVVAAIPKSQHGGLNAWRRAIFG